MFKTKIYLVTLSKVAMYKLSAKNKVLKCRVLLATLSYFPFSQNPQYLCPLNTEFFLRTSPSAFSSSEDLLEYWYFLDLLEWPTRASISAYIENWVGELRIEMTGIPRSYFAFQEMVGMWQVMPVLAAILWMSMSPRAAILNTGPCFQLLKYVLDVIRILTSDCWYRWSFPSKLSFSLSPHIYHSLYLFVCKLFICK